MQVIQGLSELVHQLPVLDGQVWVLPTTSEQIQTGDTNTLLNALYLVPGPDVVPRLAWQRWYPAAVLRRVPWGSAPIDELLDEWFCPHSQVAADFDGTFGDDDVPTTTTIPPGMSSKDRLRWWATAVRVQAWSLVGDVTEDVLHPATRIDVTACEERIGMALPASLRTYHLALGTSETAEEILPVVGGGEVLGPLLDCYPGIPDLLDGLPDCEALLDQVDQMVAFGAYLGNGNYWCVDRTDGAVWYFDHEGAMDPGWRGGSVTAVLTRMFDDPGDYFDALTSIAVGRAHEALGGQDTSEDVLRSLLGDERVRTWLY